MKPSRRKFLAGALLGVIAIRADAAQPHSSRMQWRERRDLYPEGVASGDPHSDSVILWTRYAFPGTAPRARLTVEVAEDVYFARVIATGSAALSATLDWTCRILVSGLRPGREYFYRFADAAGNGSRIGRTLTAPHANDARTARFAFASCQNVTQGAQNAFRRMIYDDEAAASSERIEFVLHLGDFIYELVWYPEDRPQGMYDRTLRDLIRYPNGEKVRDFHVPTTLEDYRTAYRAYLHDPDLQDARARWPFVYMWDNHEFSWLGWQSFQIFNGKNRPAQTVRVAAMQAWFEFQPARVRQQGNASLQAFIAPAATNVPIERFDEHGLGQEPNNLAALRCLTAYRTIRWGSNVDLFVTDQRSYRSEDPQLRPEARALSSEEFLDFIPEEAAAIIDAGRSYAGGKAPDAIPFGDQAVPNFQKNRPAQTILGAEQKAWFLEELASSSATWKIWGNSVATLDCRADLQNLPQGLTKNRWPGAGYGTFGGGTDFGNAYVERAEIYDFIKTKGIAGFATVSGDRHSFWAGLSAKALPPKQFDPVGVAFTTASISAPGLVEATEHRLAKDHPLRQLYLVERDPTVNMTMLHGVRSSLEYGKTRDMAAAKKLRNSSLSPHLSFLDWGGHGYAIVRASRDALETEFVCLGRPVARSPGTDGGPVVYRVKHRAALWKPGETPKLEQTVVEGDLGFFT
ncbi:MAG: alkaline phosphatase D family protein [Pseudomonadota bacterium]